MVVIGGDAVSTAAGLVGTILVLNFFGGALALYPRAKRPGEERGLLKQNAIQVRHLPREKIERKEHERSRAQRENKWNEPVAGA